MRLVLILYGVLVVAAPGNPNNYTFLVDTGATIVSFLAGHFFRAYLHSRPANQKNVILYSLVMMSWVCQCIGYKDYCIGVAMKFCPHLVSTMLTEHPISRFLFPGSRPITTLMFCNIFCLAFSRLLLVLTPVRFQNLDHLKAGRGMASVTLLIGLMDLVFTSLFCDNFPKQHLCKLQGFYKAKIGLDVTEQECENCPVVFMEIIIILIALAESLRFGTLLYRALKKHKRVSPASRMSHHQDQLENVQIKSNGSLNIGTTSSGQLGTTPNLNVQQTGVMYPDGVEAVPAEDNEDRNQDGEPSTTSAPNVNHTHLVHIEFHNQDCRSSYEDIECGSKAEDSKSAENTVQTVTVKNTLEKANSLNKVQGVSQATTDNKTTERTENSAPITIEDKEDLKEHSSPMHQIDFRKKYSSSNEEHIQAIHTNEVKGIIQPKCIQGVGKPSSTVKAKRPNQAFASYEVKGLVQPYNGTEELEDCTPVRAIKKVEDCIEDDAIIKTMECHISTKSAKQIEVRSPTVSLQHYLEIVEEDPDISFASQANQNLKAVENIQVKPQEKCKALYFVFDTSKKIMLRSATFSICFLIMSSFTLTNIYLQKSHNVFQILSIEMFSFTKRGYIFFLPIFLVTSEKKIVEFVNEKMHHVGRKFKIF